MPVAAFPHGRVRKLGIGESLAPFSVTAPWGSDVLVRLVSSRGQGVVEVFVGRGLPVQTKVPLGQYKLKLAYGQTWYGRQRLFGEGTRTWVADGFFDFSATSQGYAGVTVTLEMQPSGNLGRTAITREDFEK
jgi:hypothetical protein